MSYFTPLQFRGGANPNVNQNLLDIVSGGATYLPDGYTAYISSGARPGGTDRSQHALGNAIDVQIVDPSGNLISNRGDGPTGMYGLFAQGAKTVRDTYHPDTLPNMRWGGAQGPFIGFAGTQAVEDLSKQVQKGAQVQAEAAAAAAKAITTEQAASEKNISESGTGWLQYFGLICYQGLG